VDQAKTQTFDVYLLDVYPDENGGWQENDRHFLGKIDVEMVGTEIDDFDILAAMRKFTYSDLSGRKINALMTTDRRTVYAEDYYGDGEWWEVGSVKNHVPVYGLKLREETA